MSIATTLLVTRDERLLEDVLRLAAAAGVVLDVAHDSADALRSWGAAGMVLVGADQATAVAARHPGRRDQVHVVSHGPVADALFRAALGAGARDVIELPAGESWLVELLADAADGGSRRAVTVGVVGGSGGVGATTFACAVATVAATRSAALLVDLDPLGPGAARMVGFDDVPGVRWDAITESRGRFGSRSLREALPSRDGLAVLTWGVPSALAEPPDDRSVREVLAAAQRGNDVVVVDLPRRLAAAATEALSRCDHVLLLSGVTVPAVASAGRVATVLHDSARELHLVVRGRAAGLSAETVERMLGVPLLVEVGDQKRLDEHLDLGLGPVHARRGPLARGARAVLDRLATPAVAA